MQAIDDRTRSTGSRSRRSTDELRTAVNKALDEIKEDGTYTEIYKKWFKEDPPELLERTGGRTRAAATPVD